MSGAILNLDDDILHVKIVDENKFKTLAQKKKNTINLKGMLARSSNDSVCVLRYISSEESISNISDIGKNKENQLIFYAENFIIYVLVNKNTKKSQLMEIADNIENLIKIS